MRVGKYSEGSGRPYPVIDSEVILRGNQKSWQAYLVSESGWKLIT
jgi:hypothetical protein